MSLPGRWIQVVINDEQSSHRFEDFANRLASALDGQHVVGTSKTYDLSVDGKNARLGRNIRVFTTIESRISKVREDAQGFVEHHGGPLEGLYIFSARANTEDTAAQHAKAVTDVLAEHGLNPQILCLGAHSIAELVSRGYAEQEFRALYDGDLATVGRWSFYSDSDISHERMRLALSTIASKNANEVREEALDLLVLQAVRQTPRTMTQIAVHLAQRLRAGCIAQEQLGVVLTRLSNGKYVDKQNQNIVITAAGRDYLSRMDTEGGRALLQGSERIRAACEASLGGQLTSPQWQRTWDKLTMEVVGLLQAKGQELLDVISALTQGTPLKEDRTSLAQLLEGVIDRVAQTCAEAAQRPVFRQALSDAFLPGSPNGAFDWLAAVTANYAVICTLGLSSEVYNLVGSVLKQVRFLFDTDVVISYLLSEEPAHDAAVTVHRMGERFGKSVLVPAAVVEEAARHAIKSYVDHDVQVAGREPLAWWELPELQSAFTRQFERQRMMGLLKPTEWPEFIARFAGQRRYGPNGKLMPSTGLMREILIREGFAILARLDTSTVPQETKDRLRDLIAQRVRERNPKYGDYNAIVVEKARIDAELLLQVERVRLFCIDKNLIDFSRLFAQSRAST